jgi:hypothetical protein
MTLCHFGKNNKPFCRAASKNSKIHILALRKTQPLRVDNCGAVTHISTGPQAHFGAWNPVDMAAQ